MVLELLAQVYYSQASNRWHWGAGSGRSGFVAESVIRAEVDRHFEASRATLQELTRMRYSGVLSVADWETATAIELKNGHLAQAMFGSGGRANMDQAAWGRLGGHLRDEYRHLRTFAEQVARGEVTEADALRRIQQYAQAEQQAYWREWGRVRDNEAWKSLPALNQAPGDGKTRCHGNCRCHLDEREDGIHWVLGVAEHCEDCVALASGGPYRSGSM